MMVTFVSQCEHKALNRTRRVLDAFANRIGSRTWQTVITEDGLQAVKKLLRKSATKNTAVSCHWIRSRSRSEFLWVVGSKGKFNKEGFVPVNYTDQVIASSSNENDWQFLPIIESLTVFSALLHDFGKATVLFQNKLKGKNKSQSDPLRHEYISLLFLIAIVDNKSDEEWLTDLISDDIHQKISKLTIENIEKPLADLPPVASMVAWLILTHHKLPVLEEKKNAGKPIKRSELFKVISQAWGYESKKEKIAFNEWFKCTELPSKSIDWQQKVKSYAIKLKNSLSQIDTIFNSELFRPVMTYARLCLMLGDHYYSSQPKDSHWHSSVKLFANTDPQNKLKQQLDEHLVGVAKQAKKNTHKLPQFEAIFNQNIRVINNEKIGRKSPEGYQWQDDAVSSIKKWKRNNSELDKNQFGFFAVNMASTGKGKTFANAKIMQALSANEESLRYILALGLRTLTLQTGDEYKDKIGLKNDELAVLIGSKAILNLHQQKNQTGSESGTSLLDNEIIFSGDFPEQGLDTVLKNTKDRHFLYAPVLACTIDHIIQAIEVIRGGRYILPTLRLMSSDLVIDEIDDFDNEDLIAIGRLIHLAGMLGRKVMISSATIPPDLAEGYFNAYQSGWDIFAKMRGKKPSIGCAWIDEFKPKVINIENREAFKKEHDKFIKKRIEKLKEQPVRRKANIAPCSTDPREYFQAIKQAVLEKHRHHHFIDTKTNKKISIGVVRIANVDPCVALTQFLLKESLAENTEIKAMAYHSRQVLLMRHEQEKYLDKILKRNKGDEHILADSVIRKHIDNSQVDNIIFVLVATPVEEVGRDHDFDWAVIEPSSFRSFIQLAGRVLRHREKEVLKPNIAIMKYNYRALKTAGKKVAFKWPGYQQEVEDLTSYDLDKLVNTQELAKKLDATNRIQKTNSSELADIEHKVIHELLTNYESKGPESMQGWLDSDWWLTALPQQYIRFRGNRSKDMTVFLTVENIFLEKGDRDNTVEVGKNNIAIESLSELEMKNVWFTRSYVDLLTEKAKNGDLKETALIYGEINLPTYGKPLTPHQFNYNEQLGLTRQ
ncbi:type I-F CRISPR-associated helicase Cas3f [Methyloprofundus sp.]|uniref:type I-F CRISPR-associated helicase Cas3f n=1 Tax=Methyloprofundus sp. TaxID=2020875 RepID=UPI003D11877D